MTSQREKRGPHHLPFSVETGCPRLASQPLGSQPTAGRLNLEPRALNFKCRASWVLLVEIWTEWWVFNVPRRVQVCVRQCAFGFDLVDWWVKNYKQCMYGWITVSGPQLAELRTPLKAFDLWAYQVHYPARLEWLTSGASVWENESANA